MDIASVLMKYYPASLWELEGFEYGGLNWISDDPKPKESKLLDLWKLLLAEREEEQKAFEARNKEVEQKLGAMGISVADIRNLIGA